LREAGVTLELARLSGIEGASKTTAFEALPKSLSLERFTRRLSIERAAKSQAARLASDHFRAAPRRAMARTVDG